MNNTLTKTMVKLAVVATLYVIFSMIIPPLSYGEIQFRFGEILMLLPFINKKYSISLVIGCLIVNLFSPLGIVDIIFGTSATLLACLAIINLKNIWLVSIVATLINAIIVGIELNIVFSLPLFLSMFSVGFGELVVVLIGCLIFNHLIKTNHRLIELLND
ncbi:MAG: QueT transporter family protein [Bacilli bacterium]|jgi:uncharacterized membrane protein|nr:QueT transporter family protein [Bacilli bacterium]